MKMRTKNVAAIVMSSLIILLAVGLIVKNVYAEDTEWQYVGKKGFSRCKANYISLFVEDGIPYVAFDAGSKVTNRKGKLMKYTGSTWELVGGTSFSEDNDVKWVSLYVDNKVPYVAYKDMVNNIGKVMKYVDGKWELVGKEPFSGENDVKYISLYVDNNVAYVAYCDATDNNKGKVVKCINDSWELVGEREFSGDYNAGNISLCIDGGVPFVAFCDDSNKKGIVKKLINSKWEIVGDTVVDNEISHVSLNINNSVPYVVYRDHNDNQSLVSKKLNNNGEWEKIGEDISNSYPQSVASCIYNDVQYIAYSDNSDNGKKVIVKEFNGIEWEKIGSNVSDSGGENVSLYAYEDTLYVAYSDNSYNNHLTVKKYILPKIPKINIKGNNRNIENGDTTPETNNNTDFGSINVEDGTIVKTFIIQNTGLGNLTLNNVPKIEGVNAGDFTITKQPENNLGEGESTTFEVTFNPNLSGEKNATIVISSNDSIDNKYSFNIRGIGLLFKAPEINIKGNCNSNHTDFGSTNVNNGIIERTFIIENIGLDKLIMSGEPKVEIIGSDANDFNITAQPESIVEAGDSTFFTVLFDPSVEGERTAIISIENNDSDENPYRFNIKGTGTINSSRGRNHKKKTSEDKIDVKINGHIKDNIANITTTKEDNKTISQIEFNQNKLQEQLYNKASYNVSVDVKNKADIVKVHLNGQMIKDMENKKAIIQIETEKAVYTLPVAQINIDEIRNKIDENAKLEDIKVNIQISAISEELLEKQKYDFVVQPIEFKIVCTKLNKTVKVEDFNSYIEKTIIIPEGIDTNNITTGVYINSDGAVSYVPTKIINKNGRCYAKIKSLTNGVYTVILNNKNFEDVEDHWAKDEINEMGTRLIIKGTNESKFDPDRQITRAEFVKTLITALGLKENTNESKFKDIKKEDWYFDSVCTAYEYGIIRGYEGQNTFRPNNTITREEAIVMIMRVMTLAGVDTKLNNNNDLNKEISRFIDKDSISDWASKAFAYCINKGIIEGNNKKLMPKENITRGETAVIIIRLLQKSDLI